MKKGRIGGQKMVAKEGKGLPCCCFRLQPVGWKEKERKMKEREEDRGWLYNGGKRIITRVPLPLNESCVSFKKKLRPTKIMAASMPNELDAEKNPRPGG